MLSEMGPKWPETKAILQAAGFAAFREFNFTALAGRVDGVFGDEDGGLWRLSGRAVWSVWAVWPQRHFGLHVFVSAFSRLC